MRKSTQLGDKADAGSDCRGQGAGVTDANAASLTMTSTDRRPDLHSGADLAFEEGEVLRLILAEDRRKVTAAKRASPTPPVEGDPPTPPGAKEARNP